MTWDRVGVRGDAFGRWTRAVYAPDGRVVLPRWSG